MIKTCVLIGKISLKNEVFDTEYNPSLIHEVVVAQLANARQGTKSALTRSEVKGGSKKPYRQKKTGRARQGSTVAPHQIGGGVAFAPKPRDFSKKINRQAKVSAIKSALSEKARTKEMLFVNEFKTQNGKTKEAQAILDAFKIEKSVLVVLDSGDVITRRSLKNIPNCKVIASRLINVYDVVSSDKVIMTEKAAKLIEEAYAK